MSFRYLSSILGENALFRRTLFFEGFGFSSNFYVILGDHLTIIDPANDYTAFIELFKLGFKPSDIKRVILTHGHLDHSAGVLELMMNYPSFRSFELVLHENGPFTLKRAVKEFGGNVVELKGGEEVGVGDLKLKVIYTPGHTIDSICLYHEETKAMFTGDTVLKDFFAAPDLFAGGCIDYYLLSLRSLRKLDVRYILPGHGSPISTGSKEAVEGAYEEAIKELIGAVGAKVRWEDVAITLAEKGYLEEAIFCCDKELELNPINYDILKLKASCLNDVGRFDEAIEIFDRILVNCKDVFALVGKGYALIGLKKFDESLKCFNEALKIDPRMREALVGKGIALYLLDRHEEAMDIPEFKEEFKKVKQKPRRTK
jgi:glyoxylase-like metal-dependent hydrolase (beta-lactamase superfamily II)